jgi:hypothetical protein
MLHYQYRTGLAMRVATKALFWLTCLAVVAIAFAPSGSLPSHVFEWWDKAQHAAAFATLMLLGRWAYPESKFALPLGLLALGAGIEIGQAVTGWRKGDLADWVADAVGVAVVRLMQPGRVRLRVV